MQAFIVQRILIETNSLQLTVNTKHVYWRPD